MQFVEVFLFFMHICVIGLQAKAVSKGPKQVTFQGLDQSSPIRVIPQWYTIAKQASPQLAQHISEFVPTINENRYDLSNYGNLDNVFDLDASKAKEKSKKPNRPKADSRSRKFKGQMSGSNIQMPKKKSDVFLEDQVFIENKHQRSERKIRSIPSIKPIENIKDDTSDNGSEKSCDSHSLVMETSVGHVVKQDESHIQSSKLQSNNKAVPKEIDRKQFKNPDESLSHKDTRTSIKTSAEEPIKTPPTNPHKHDEQMTEKRESNSLKTNSKNTNKKTTSNPTLQKPKSEVKESPSNIQDLPVTSMTPEDKHLMQDEVTNLFDVNFRSFVFNPQAQPQEVFQECTTVKNETGHCRYVQHCMLPSILSSIQHFMDNVCIIEERFVGICCPEFPVSTLQISWSNKLSNSSEVNEVVKTPEDCGIGTNTRIVGGSDADRKAWPWMVALLNNRNKFFCGGSLINNRYVLTASHCTFSVPRGQIIARLGEYDFKDARETHDDYMVIEIKRHGQYSRLTLRNDIALLKLERPVVFNEFVKTVCLPKAKEDFLDRVATLVGWGNLNGAASATSDVLQEASFPIIKNIECTQSHGVTVPPSLICAATPSKDKGACNGDSGGPLMLLDDDGRWKVIGLVSWGRRGCSPSFPTVYTRVTHYLDWIQKHAI